LTKLITIAYWKKKKTNFLIFCSSKIKPDQSFDIKIDNECFTQVDSAKYLGAIFDASLTCKNYMDEACFKMSKTVGFLISLTSCL